MIRNRWIIVLKLTTSATDALQQARDAQDIPDTYGVRVAAQATANGEAGLALGFTEEPAEGDEVTEQHGLDVYVAPEVAEPLADSLIDVEDTVEGAQLVVKPQEE